VAEVLLTTGERVQKSVFECVLEPEELEGLIARLQREIGETAGNVSHLSSLCGLPGSIARHRRGEGDGGRAELRHPLRTDSTLGTASGGVCVPSRGRQLLERKCLHSLMLESVSGAGKVNHPGRAMESMSYDGFRRLSPGGGQLFWRPKCSSREEDGATLVHSVLSSERGPGTE